MEVEKAKAKELTPAQIQEKLKSEMFKSNITSEVQTASLGLQKFTVITNELESTQLSSSLAYAKKLRKAGEDLRKKKTAALDDMKKLAIAAERDFFSDLDTRIEKGNEILMKFKQDQIDAANAAAEKIRVQAEKEAKRKRSVESIAKVEEKAQEALKAVPTVSGMRKTWQYEVIDETKIPREYLTVDHAKLKKAVADGVRSIAGTKIEEKFGLSGR